MRKHPLLLVSLCVLLALGLAGFALAEKKKPVALEKEVQKPGQGGDVKLAQQLAGTWRGPDDSIQLAIWATGAKVQGFLFDFDTQNTLLKFEAVVEKSRLVGTTRWRPNDPDGGAQVPLNSEIKLSRDGRNLILAFGGVTVTVYK